MDAAPGAGRLFARGLATSAGRDAGKAARLPPYIQTRSPQEPELASFMRVSSAYAYFDAECLPSRQRVSPHKVQQCYCRPGVAKYTPRDRENDLDLPHESTPRLHPIRLS